MWSNDYFTIPVTFSLGVHFSPSNFPTACEIRLMVNDSYSVKGGIVMIHSSESSPDNYQLLLLALSDES